MAATVGMIPLLYVTVRDRGTGKDGKTGRTARYTRGFLASTLQFMGCKSRHAVKVGVCLKSRMLACRFHEVWNDFVRSLLSHAHPLFYLIC